MSPPETVSTKPFPKVAIPAAVHDASRKRELALIHMAKAHLGLTRADYEYLIRTVTQTNKTSAADLTYIERHKLLQHFKKLGFEVKPKAGSNLPIKDPQVRKLRAMWYALAEAGEIERPDSPIACDAAVEAWAQRQINAGGAWRTLGQLHALRFASGAQLTKLIEDMKSWSHRVGL